MLTLKTVVHKVWPPDAVKEVGEVESLSIIILKHYLPFAFSFSHKCSVEFSGDYITCDMETLKKEADNKIQSSAVKPDIKEICKNVRQCHSIILFWKIVTFLI